MKPSDLINGLNRMNKVLQPIEDVIGLDQIMLATTVNFMP